LATERGLKVATHSWSDAVAIIANAHVVASANAGLTVEVDRTGTPFVDELLTTPLEIRDGRLILSHAPGLGITVDDETVGRYLMLNHGTIAPGNYSDMTFASRVEIGSDVVIGGAEGL
jgi:L-alanine-DL-glutamate epimerase-like enolase superfamily enzyme